MRAGKIIWVILFAFLLPWFMVIEIIACAWHTRRGKGEGYQGWDCLICCPFAMKTAGCQG